MNRDSGALNAACDFLDAYLSDGPKPSVDVYAAADRARISRATLRRAAQRLRVKRTRRPATGPWLMYIPAARAAPRRYPARAATWAGTRSATEDDIEDDYDDDEDDYDDDEDDYDDDEELERDEDLRTAGSSWSWFVPVAIFVCGLGGVALARRRFGSFSIAGTNGMSLRPFTTPQPPRKYVTVAPCPSDEAIYGSDAAVDDETLDRPIVRLSAYSRFATFPGAFEFAPESDTG